MSQAWIIMPYRGNLAQTAEAMGDALDQSIPDFDLLLIQQGGEGLPAAVYHTADAVRTHRWHHDPPLPSLAATWNTALRMVWALGGEHALVVNNDVRLHPDTYRQLLAVQRREQAWFVTGVGVTPEQFNRHAILEELAYVDGHGREGSEEGRRLAKGGPDFSCFLITRACHHWFQFDEGFQPAYYEDNDYHRRLQLAGFGGKIFGTNLPFLHYGSGTLKADEKLRAGWAPMFERTQAHYLRKWGGLPGHETFATPTGLTLGPGVDPRHYMTGQGTEPWTLPTEALFP